MKFTVKGYASKTLIEKAKRMLKNGQTEFSADYGYKNINVFEHGSKKYASITTTKRVKVGKDRYHDIAGDNAVVFIEE
jgi:methylphosphotriester-DNA--protein-cysteine methyltransferase